MSQKTLIPLRAGQEDYHEETVRLPAALTLLLVTLIAVPLVYWMILINREGTRTADVSQYTVLVEALDSNVRTVGALLRDDTEELAALQETSNLELITRIVPDIIIVEEKSDAAKPTEIFDATLNGIYWSPSNPLVGLDNDTYGVGDIVQNYEIIQIGKSEVRLQSPDGEILIMDMNEDLHKFK